MTGAAFSNASAAAAAEPASPGQTRDPGSGVFEWPYKGDPSGPKCKVSGSVGGAVTADGFVLVTGRFWGCIGGTGLPENIGDGDFTVSGWKSGDKEHRQTRSFGWCPTDKTPLGEPCMTTLKIPFTGAATYCGFAAYMDLGWMRATGSMHDPGVFPCRYVSGVPGTFPPGNPPQPPVNPPPPTNFPPPVGPPPVTCPQVSSVGGLADGTLLQTCDTGRIYKMVGGAPLWMTTCGSGMCPTAPLKVTQAIVDAGPAWPADSSTAHDEAGHTFKFVGGAPIHLANCNVGCGNPVPIPAGTLQLVDPGNHMRQRPVDGATAKDEAGNTFKYVGGAPIHLSSCAVGCGNPVPINGWSIAALDHMNPQPSDGATAKDEAGNVFKFVGGAPIRLSNCSVGCGNPVPITAWSIGALDHMNARPADWSTAKDEAGNIFKYVGGAPIHLFSCSVGCGNPVPINGWSIAALDHMNARPADSATARDEAGHIFKFVGGAPIHLASCNVGCGNPVQITGASVSSLDHMNPQPTDSATAKDESGNIFKFVGGAPVRLANCNVGCGAPVLINGWSVANLEHMNPKPRDGATAHDETGHTFKFVGGAPIKLANCNVDCGSPVSLNGWSIANLEHMNPYPTDGATAKDEANNIFKFVGGAPVRLARCDVGCGNPVPINGWSIANVDHMRPFPIDGATAKDESGNIFKFVGGAPIHLTSCDVDCGNPVLITGWSVANLEHMRGRPADGATARDESGNVFKFVGGAPIRLMNCQVGCGMPVFINGGSVVNLDHMNPQPADGSTARDESGNIFRFAGGAPVRLTTCAPVCSPYVDINRWSVDNREHMTVVPRDGALLRAVETNAVYKVTGGVADKFDTCPGNCPAAAVMNEYSLYHFLEDGSRVKDAASSSEGAIVGAALVPFHSQAERDAAGYGNRPQLVIPNRLWTSLPTTIGDGTRIKNAAATTEAAIVGGARIDFHSPAERDQAGYGTKPMVVIPERVWKQLPTKIADGTRLWDALGLGQASVVGGARIDFANQAEVDATGYNTKPLQKIPNRVWKELPTKIADGTRLWDALDLGQAAVVGGARIGFANQAEVDATGYNTKPLQKVANRVWKSLPTTPAEGTRIKGPSAPAVSLVVGGRRLEFADVDTMILLECGGAPVQVVPDRTYNGLPLGIDPLFAAANRAVDVSRIEPAPFWRKNCKKLYREDGRPPGDIFATGFEPRDINGTHNLHDYVGANPPSPFVGTSYRDDMWQYFAEKYQYEVDAPGGIDINATLGPHPLDYEREVAFPGGLDKRFIVRGCPYAADGKIIADKCVSNPGYVPWRGSSSGASPSP
ncbi:hypothetical protein [Amycolatopsis sp. 195334CR]|uniref:scabin-related ADP-ribosyltransferase n=1 Tax=Amycolatopsis sp. 195334CR TaxID=2814588 RepID=UPI001A8DE844|nr:hypothetical protein [Amycolatopsis sp. 195334CR]MBN6034102.1 hypothetical protein [Amycolatopsis sp. 195334CR]